LTPSQPPSPGPAPRPHPIPVPEPLCEARNTDDAGSPGANGGRADNSQHNSEKPEKASPVKKVSNIDEDIKKEPVLRMLIDVFEGEILNQK
jgi:hypothetical protein